MSKKKGLNTGRVDLLFSKPIENVVKEQESGLREVLISKLVPSRFQPRRFIKEEELKELAESIKKQGILQPIVVREISGGFEIIAGERRWRAAELAGLQNVPVVIKDLNDSDAMIIALIENIQRENLNPVEEAIALDRLSKECGLTHEETAKAVGKSRAAISNLLRVLTLNPDVKSMLERGEINLGHAKVLLSVGGKQQSEFAKSIVEKDLSVRETEKLISHDVHLTKKEKVAYNSVDPDIVRLQRSLSEKMGAATRIVHNEKGNGKIVIKYNSLDELDGILEHIK